MRTLESDGVRPRLSQNVWYPRAACRKGDGLDSITLNANDLFDDSLMLDIPDELPPHLAGGSSSSGAGGGGVSEHDSLVESSNEVFHHGDEGGGYDRGGQDSRGSREKAEEEKAEEKAEVEVVEVEEDDGVASNTMAIAAFLRAAAQQRENFRFLTPRQQRRRKRR